MEKKKLDKRLKEALDKAVAKKNAKSKQKQNANQTAREEHEKFLKKWLPKARVWIKEKLFAQITEAEANGQHYILLGHYEDSIPSEVIYEACKKIKGLQPVAKDVANYKDIDGNPVYQDKTTTYSIEWDSTDPNDHRND